MTFIQNITPKGLQLPLAAAKLGGFSVGDPVYYHVRDGVMVVTRGRMTAAQLLAAAQALRELSVDLDIHLARLCGQCVKCGDACSLTDPKDGESLPPEALEMFAAANICLGELKKHLAAEDIVYGL